MPSDKTNTVLRVGVIGAGVMGTNHARVLSELPHFDFVGIADPDPGNRKRAETLIGARSFSTVEELIDQDLDCAIVAVPNALHRIVGELCLSAGLHILMEKPLAPTIEEGEALIEAARRADRQLMVGHIERFNPAVATAARAVSDSSVRSISITRVGPFPPRMSNVGVIIDLGVHDIDIIRHIAEADIVDVQAQISGAGAGRPEDTALLQFRTANDIVAHVSTNWTTPYKKRSLEITTDQKFLTVDLMTRTVVEYFDYRPDGAFSMRQHPVPMVEPLKAELISFYDAARTNTPPPVTGHDGLRNLAIALACLESGTRARARSEGRNHL
jgi:UDP-N-acetylglucosamine 3-dehydrogenase